MNEPVVLPSESAQDLAYYLYDHRDEYGEYEYDENSGDVWVINQTTLARVIQRYWDSLL